MKHRNKYTGIDLLPESVTAPKRYRKRVIQLAAAQVAIFLCLAAMAVALNLLERQAWDESHRLAMQVYTLRHGPAVTAAAYVQDITRRVAAEGFFLEANAPADFDPQWLTAIMSSDNGYMTTWDYSRGAIMLTGIVEDISKIETHRQSLLETEIFQYVRIGRVALQDGDRFFYELLLGIW